MGKLCSKCNQTKEIEQFYKQKDRKNGSYQCKSCFNSYCINRWIKIKQKAIDYKGSKCNKCGIFSQKTNYCIFDFHHRNPKNKDYDWNKLRLKSWNKIIEELDKCDLLCSNCHRITHFEMEHSEGIEPFDILPTI